jgi:hypothetical protein
VGTKLHKQPQLRQVLFDLDPQEPSDLSELGTDELGMLFGALTANLTKNRSLIFASLPDLYLYTD